MRDLPRHRRVISSATTYRAAPCASTHFARGAKPQASVRGICLCAATLCSLTIAGCGYTLGSPYAAEIRSVHVPAFTTSANRRGVEYQLTEAVQKQIQQRSHFRLVKESDADTRLTGRIVDVTKRMLSQTGVSDPRQLELNVQVQVTWEDLRTGEILRQQNIPITTDMLTLAAQGDFAPEIGQSLATGTNDAVNRLARNIVDMMEAPWP